MSLTTPIRLLVVAIVAAGCKLGGNVEPSVSSQEGTRQAGLQVRPGNPNRAPLEGGPRTLRLGLDLPSRFEMTNAACPGAQLTAFIQFAEHTDASKGSLTVSNMGGSRQMEILNWNIPAETKKFDFVELEAVVASFYGFFTPVDWTVPHSIMVRQEDEAGNLLWQSDRVTFEFAAPSFTVLQPELVKQEGDMWLLRGNVKAMPVRQLKVPGPYTCVFPKEAGTYLKMSAFRTETPLYPWVKFLRLDESTPSAAVFQSQTEQPITFASIHERDLEPLFDAGPVAAAIVGVNRGRPPRVLSNEFEVRK